MLYRSVLGESFDSPFSPKLKCDPFSAIASGVTGILGSIVGNHTNERNIEFQREANEKNIALQRETNRQNENLYRLGLAESFRQMQAQNAYNTDMWNKTNEYNDPSKVVARLRQAGINPALSYGQPANASAVQSGSQGQPSSPQMQSPSVGAPYVDNYMPSAIQGASTAFNAFIQDRLAQKTIEEKNVDIREKELKVAFDAESFKSRLLQQMNSAKRGSIEYESAKRQLDLFNDVYDYNVRLASGQSSFMDKQVEEIQQRIAKMNLENEQLKIINHYLPKLNDAQLAQIRKSIQVANSQINLNNSNAADSLASASLKAVQESGVKLDNETKKNISQYVIDKAREEVYALEDERYIRPFDLNYRMQGKAGEYFPMPSGQFGASELYNKNNKRNRFRR